MIKRLNYRVILTCILVITVFIGTFDINAFSKAPYKGENITNKTFSYFNKKDSL